MNLKKSFIKNNIHVLAANIFIYLSGIFLTPLVIKTSGEGTYGQYVLIISVLGVIYGLSSLGVGHKARRLIASENQPEKRAELFYPPFIFQFSISLVIGLLLILFLPFFNRWFFEDSLGVKGIYLLIYLLLYFLYSQSVDFFRNTHRMGNFSTATLFQPYAHIGISLFIYFYTGSLDVRKLLYSQVISFFIIGSFFMFMLVREIGFKPKFPQINVLKYEIAFGLPIVFGYIVDQILAISDRYVIAGFFSVNSVAYYTVAYSLGSLPVFFAKVSGVVLPPILSLQVDNDNQEEGEKMVNATIKGYLLLTIPYIFGCAILGYPILELYANSSTAREGHIIMPVVAFGIVFYGLSLILMNVLFVSMKTRDMFSGNLTAAVLNLGLNFLFIPLIGNIIVAAVTTVFSYLVLFGFIYYKLRKIWNMKIDKSFILKVIGSSVMMFAFLSIMLNGESNVSLTVERLVGLMFGGFGVYGIFILIFQAVDLREIITMLEISRK